MPDNFQETVERILGENGAVESISRGSEEVRVVAHSRAGKTAKDDIIVDPVLEGLDATYGGTSNGWENYTVHDNDTEASVDESEVREQVPAYKDDAADSRRHTPSFREWYDSETQ